MQQQETRMQIVQPQAGLAHRFANSLITVKATAAGTNGIFSLFEIHTPAGEAMPAHLQRYEDEAFWVLAGTVSFVVAGQAFDLDAGGYVYVPRGTLHGFRNQGRVPATLLSLMTPGGIQERFLAEAGQSAVESGTRPAADWSRLARIAEKYGIELLPPPGE